MKVFYLDMESFGKKDMVDALRRYRSQGKETEICFYSVDLKGERYNPEKEAAMAEAIRKFGPDMVFSFNYFPLASKVCQAAGVRYAAWVYDNPQVLLYSYTLINSVNAVFLFDSEVYAEFASQGIRTVHYLPLAAAPDRLTEEPVTEADRQRYSAPVSFVGSLYTEDHDFYSRMEAKLSEHTKGYLEGLMDMQLRISGYDFIRDLLTPELLRKLQAALPLEPNPDGCETLKYLFSDYVLSRKLTGLERTGVLGALGTALKGADSDPGRPLFTAEETRVMRGLKENGGQSWEPVMLYTKDPDVRIPGTVNRGIAEYYRVMSKVFRASRINLNITLRSIRRGIPLRCFDIMGSGGFLMTNYQADLLRHFEADRDFVYYEDTDDLIRKTVYYLRDEEARCRIAENGLARIKAEHTYDIRLQQMLEMIGLS